MLQATPTAEPLKPVRLVVELTVLDELNSKISAPGERFRIQLAEPIVVDDQTIVPAGLLGEGEVIHAAKARAGGKAGELVLAARFLDCRPGQRITLGYFRLGGAGVRRDDKAFLASAVVPFAGLFVVGGQMLVPVGTRAQARVTSDLATVTPCVVASPVQP